MDISFDIKVAKRPPALTGRDYYWSLMMDREMKGDSFTVPEIHSLTNNHRDVQVRAYATLLERAGIIQRTGEQDDSGSAIFRVVQRSSTAPVFKKDGTLVADAMTGRQALWNAMRSPAFRAGFTVVDISVFASTDTLRVTRSSTERYAAALLRAGYLRLLRKRAPNSPAIWQLIRNTGPDAPKLLRIDCFFDPNTRQIVGEPKAREVAQ